MEAVYANLEKAGKNDADSLVKWMKDSKIIDQTKAQEDKLRTFFDDVEDKKNVSLEKFKEIMQKVADEFKINLDGMAKKLAETGPKMLQNAVEGATSKLTGAVTGLFSKK